MATDRLAASRGQQTGTNNRYEMSTMHSGNGAPAASGDMSAFWVEVTAVQELLMEYDNNVSLVANLQQRSLNNIDDQPVSQQLEQVSTSNRKLSNELKQRIKALQATGGDSRDGQIRRAQATLLKEKFRTALSNYQQVEQKQRIASKSQMERQYRIVKPDASPEEVRAVVEASGGQIFQQALMNSDEYGQTRAAYREVQERHDDIVKITETMRELQQLMNDMAMAVEEQGEIIHNVEQTTAAVEREVEQGLEQTYISRMSAVSARKKKWMCFCIAIVVLIILIIIIVGVLISQGLIGQQRK